MTLSEFKAWFEGFTEGIEGAPTARQFDRIKAKVSEINGVAVTERVYVDRWWPTVRPYWYQQYVHADDLQPLTARYSAGAVSADAKIGNAVIETNPLDKAVSIAMAEAKVSANALTLFESWDSHSAMRDIGKAEAQVA